MAKVPLVDAILSLVVGGVVFLHMGPSRPDGLDVASKIFTGQVPFVAVRQVLRRPRNMEARPDTMENATRPLNGRDTQAGLVFEKARPRPTTTTCVRGRVVVVEPTFVLDRPDAKVAGRRPRPGDRAIGRPRPYCCFYRERQYETFRYYLSR